MPAEEKIRLCHSQVIVVPWADLKREKIPDAVEKVRGGIVGPYGSCHL